jgi:hypothetical protein
MSTEDNSENNIHEEFNSLGKNFLKAVQSAWDRPERKRIENEIAKGLDNLSTAIKKETENFSDSPTAQKMKTEIDHLGERIKNEETQQKFRKGVIDILKNANSELEKAINKLSTEEKEGIPEDET